MPHTIPTKPSIRVDCMCYHDKSLVSESFRLMLHSIIEQAKESPLWLSRPEVCHKTDFKKGYRYKDTDRCVDVILGNMRLASQRIVNEYNDKPTSGFYTELDADINIHFAHYLNRYTSEELTQWVDSCLEYSGGCDHWYTYEKQWD